MIQIKNIFTRVLEKERKCLIDFFPLRLDLTPPTLFTLALDASCQVMENRKFTSQVPRTVAQAINDRMPKFIYERARKMVDDKHGGVRNHLRAMIKMGDM